MISIHAGYYLLLNVNPFLMTSSEILVKYNGTSLKMGSQRGVFLTGMDMLEM